jgi:RNA polymerase sigma factor (TIGR02999 family)
MSSSKISLVENPKSFEDIYTQLKQIAKQRLSKHRPLTLLDSTCLAHEVVLKLLAMDTTFNDRKHLLAYAATTMRSIVVDYERERGTQKRFAEVTGLTDIDIETPDPKLGVMVVDQALTRLHEFDPELVTLIEMRCFLGLKVEEIAAELQLSERTVKRNWQKARAFLQLML